MRFEFVEVLLRLAHHKYFLPVGGAVAWLFSRLPVHIVLFSPALGSPTIAQGVREMEEALTLLVDAHIVRYCGPEIAHNRNDFRYDRLYRQPVSAVLQAHAPFLDALYVSKGCIACQGTLCDELTQHSMRCRYEMLSRRFAKRSGQQVLPGQGNKTFGGKEMALRLPMRAWIEMVNEAQLVDSVRVDVVWASMQLITALASRTSRLAKHG